MEVCGFLAGVGGRVSKVYPVTNVASNPEVAFYMDPVEQLAALKDIDKQDLTLLAAYHSHPPGGPEEPSPTDVALNLDPALLHLIFVTDTAGNLTSCRAFRLSANSFREIALILQNASGPVRNGLDTHVF